MSVRPVGPEELSSWRRRLPRGWARAVAVPRQRRRSDAGVEAVGEDSAAFTVPELTPKRSEDVYEQTVRLLVDAAKRTRVDFKQALAQLRKYQPGLLAGMSDEQAAVRLEAAYREQVEESVRRVFRQRGRDKELVVRIGEP